MLKAILTISCGLAIIGSKFSCWWFRYEIGKLYHRYIERDIPFSPWDAFSTYGFLWLFKRIDYQGILTDYPRDTWLPKQIQLVKRLKWLTFLLFMITLSLIILVSVMQ